MQLAIALFGLLLLIPAALAGIAAGLRDLATSSNIVLSQLDQLTPLVESLWPVGCALALISGSGIILSTGIWLLARGLQSRA